MRNGIRRARITIGLAALLAVAMAGRAAEPVEAVTFDYAAESGANYDKAEFRLWLPKNVERVRAIVLLVPGSNGDGRVEVEDPVWQTFAIRNNLALVSCYLTDKPHEYQLIESYAYASRGSGQALLDALDAMGQSSGHGELAKVPLLLWGMSAGGEFNYEFVAWRPDRVAAFVVNKGGVYYLALLSPDARNVPGLFFVGDKDLEFRTSIIVGLFAVNRRFGALWGLVNEPNTDHDIGRSRDVALLFFEDVLVKRLDKQRSDKSGARHLRAVAMTSGVLGDLKARKITGPSGPVAPDYPTAWFISERVGKAWQDLVNERWQAKLRK